MRLIDKKAKGWHYRNWWEYAMENILLVGGSFVLVLVNAVCGTAYLGWWSVYYACYVVAMILMVVVLPVRYIRKHKRMDEEFIMSMTDTGMPVVLAEKILQLIESGQTRRASKIACEWSAQHR